MLGFAKSFLGALEVPNILFIVSENSRLLRYVEGMHISLSTYLCCRPCQQAQRELRKTGVPPLSNLYLAPEAVFLSFSGQNRALFCRLFSAFR